MRIDRIILAFALLQTPACVHAQVEQAGRYEIPLVDASKPYELTSLGERGLLLYGVFIADGSEAIELTRLDTALHEVWKGFIKIEKSVTVLFAQTKDDHVYLLLRERFNNNGRFIICSASIANGDYTLYDVFTLIPFNPTNFEITKDAALVGGYFNYRPLILHYSFTAQHSKILPGFFNEPGDLNQMRVKDDGSVDVVVSARNYEKKKCLWIRSYDAGGELVKTIVLSPDPDKNLIYGRSVQTGDGQQMVCGVYGRYSDYSRGIFMATINEFGEYNINYYNFADLERFFNYMRARHEKRVKERIERRKVQGKKLRFNYRIMVDEVVPYGDQFIMLGEAFYPHYTYASRSYSGAMLMSRGYNMPMTRGDLVFDGYQYTHAVVIGFGADGSLKWDNSFEINDVRTMQLKQFVKIRPEDNRIVLLYLFDNVIRSKIIKEQEILEGKTFDALKMRFSDDVVHDRGTESSKLEYWYGRVFYASGVQQVKNLRDAGVSMNRRVFFINKVDYK